MIQPLERGEDDINDTGETFKWIVKDWESGCLPDDPAWIVFPFEEWW